MKTFILLATLSPQGLQTLRFTPERLLEVNREIEDLGGRVLQLLPVERGSDGAHAVHRRVAVDFPVVPPVQQQDLRSID